MGYNSKLTQKQWVNSVKFNYNLNSAVLIGLLKSMLEVTATPLRTCSNHEKYYRINLSLLQI